MIGYVKGHVSTRCERRPEDCHTHCFHGRYVPGRVWVCRSECDLIERVLERLGDRSKGLEVVMKVLRGLEC